MNSVVVLAAVACLAQSVLTIHVPVYPSGIHGSVYPGVHGVAYHGVHNAAPPGHLTNTRPHSAPAGVYSGHIATPLVLPSGFIADTPEVAALRGAHLTSLANARAAAAARGGNAHYAPNNGQWASDGSYARANQVPAGGRYAGPIASPVVLPSGFLADTPEVAAAKAAHLSKVAGAAAKAAHLASLARSAAQGYHRAYAGHGYHHG